MFIHVLHGRCSARSLISYRVRCSPNSSQPRNSTHYQQSLPRFQKPYRGRGLVVRPGRDKRGRVRRSSGDRMRGPWMAKRVWRGRIALAKRRLMGGRKQRSDVMVIADNSRKGVWFLGRPWLTGRRLRTGLDSQLALRLKKLNFSMNCHRNHGVERFSPERYGYLAGRYHLGAHYRRGEWPRPQTLSQFR
jgi:hypothetical protein